jgi:sporulation protein YlmC with PRC-barrel domain
MSNENCNTGSISISDQNNHPQTTILGASKLNGDDVYNPKGEKLGSIKEIMLDIQNGKVAYAVLSFGGFLSMGEKLFAVPWSALKVDLINKRFTFDMDEDRLKNAPGFDSDHWPNMADQTWAKTINTHYGTQMNSVF